MANENLKIDENTRWTLGALTNDVNQEIKNLRVNPVTGRLIVEANVASNNTSIGGTIPGGTEGSVLFLGPGSTLAQDNANFFYDDTSNFLGLGTNTPAATLHVSGTVQFDLGGDATGDIFYRDAGGNITNLPIGSDTQVLQVVAGLPSWQNQINIGAYNTIENQGVAVTQRTTINLTNLLTATDVGGKTELDINVANLAADNTFTSALDLSTIGGLLDWTQIDQASVSVDLTTQVTGTLPVDNGGTGATTLTGVLHGNGISAVTAIPLTTDGAILIGDGVGAPTTLNAFSSATGTLNVANGGTGLASYAQGDLLYATGATTLAKLAKDTNATRYLSNTGGSNNPAWAQVDLTNGVTGVLPVANGGGGAVNVQDVLLFDDFISLSNPDDAASNTFRLSGNFIQEGSNLSNWDSETNHPGVVYMAVSDDDILGYTDAGGVGLIPTTADFNFTINAKSTRPGISFNSSFGLTNDAGGLDIYIEFGSASSTTKVVYDLGAGTVVSAIDLPVSGTWFTAVFDYVAGTNTMTLTIDNQTIVSGNPTFTDNSIGFAFGNVSNGTTAFAVDYVKCNYQVTR